jgi:hypothetical protein
MALQAAASWLERCSEVVCYVDEGVTADMQELLSAALARGKEIEFRRLIGGVTVEKMHFAGVAHTSEQCAICLGPRRVAELKDELAKKKEEENHGGSSA